MTLTEETLLKLIKDLSKRDGYCFALNKMLAETCRISERQVRRILSKFEDEGVVTVTFYKNVSRMREIRVVERAEIVTLPVGQYVHVPGHIVRPLNKGVDIKLDTWKKERKKPPDKPPRKTYDEILDEYTDDEVLRSLLGEWLRGRTCKNRYYTNTALEAHLQDLETASRGFLGEKIKIVEQSLKKRWNGFYPLPEATTKSPVEIAKHQYTDDQYADLFKSFDEVRY